MSMQGILATDGNVAFAILLFEHSQPTYLSNTLFGSGTGRIIQFPSQILHQNVFRIDGQSGWLIQPAMHAGCMLEILLGSSLITLTDCLKSGQHWVHSYPGLIVCTRMYYLIYGMCRWLCYHCFSWWCMCIELHHQRMCTRLHYRHKVFMYWGISTEG